MALATLINIGWVLTKLSVRDLVAVRQSSVVSVVRNRHFEIGKSNWQCEPAVMHIGNDPIKSNADVVREACHVVWTKGQVDRAACAIRLPHYGPTAWYYSRSGLSSVHD